MDIKKFSAIIFCTLLFPLPLHAENTAKEPPAPQGIGSAAPQDAGDKTPGVNYLQGLEARGVIKSGPSGYGESRPGPGNLDGQGGGPSWPLGPNPSEGEWNGPTVMPETRGPQELPVSGGPAEFNPRPARPGESEPSPDELASRPGLPQVLDTRRQEERSFLGIGAGPRDPSPENEPGPKKRNDFPVADERDLLPPPAAEPAALPARPLTDFSMSDEEKGNAFPLQALLPPTQEPQAYEPPAIPDFMDAAGANLPPGMPGVPPPGSPGREPEESGLTFFKNDAGQEGQGGKVIPNGIQRVQQTGAAAEEAQAAVSQGPQNTPQEPSPARRKQPKSNPNPMDLPPPPPAMDDSPLS